MRHAARMRIGGNSDFYDVIIHGGGMVGLAQAIALAQLGLSVAVLDRSDFETQHLPEFDGRVCALALGTRYILENLGVWSEMQSHAQPILDIRVLETGGFAQVHYDHRRAGDQPMGYIIENRHTRIALAKAATEYPQITFMAPQQITSAKVLQGEVEATLENGKLLRGRLLLAADGRYSQLRQAMGLSSTVRDYHQTAIVATIDHAQPHNGVAVEWFFPTGPFAVLPLPGNQSSLVWVEPTATAQALLALPAEQALGYLQEKMQGYLGEVKFATRLWSYPLRAVLVPEYVAPRFALIGDAAHGMHPIAGQGANLGFRDVAVLHQVVQQALAAGEDIGSLTVLQRYQQGRRFDAMAMIGATDGINALFSNANKPLFFARNAGFSIVNRWPKLRDLFMRHAMGLVGDLPPLSQPSQDMAA